MMIRGHVFLQIIPLMEAFLTKLWRFCFSRIMCRFFLHFENKHVESECLFAWANVYDVSKDNMVYSMVDRLKMSIRKVVIRVSV